MTTVILNLGLVGSHPHRYVEIVLVTGSASASSFSSCWGYLAQAQISLEWHREAIALVLERLVTSHQHCMVGPYLFMPAWQPTQAQMKAIQQ